MRIADLCCGAGGAAMGLHQAFPDAEIVGVDVQPQPRYPFTFVQGDALTFDLAGFDFAWASPPCQAYSTSSGRAAGGRRAQYPDLVAPVRARLRRSGLPYIIENVVGAPLLSPVRLCGSSFGLDVQRHRLFELGGGCSAALWPPCAHGWQTRRFRSLDSHRRGGALARVIGVHGHLNYAGEGRLRCQAMGIDWMTQEELTQAIPPAYSKFLAQFIPLPVEQAA
jgi:DNA (cytosine-5)-methyltransferase 1